MAAEQTFNAIEDNNFLEQFTKSDNINITGLSSVFWC